MRRSLWQRAFASLFAIWFTISLVEPAALHSCPVHGGGTVSATGGHGGGDHAGHDMPTAPTDAPSDHAQCTCLGDCTVGSATTIVPASAFELLTAIIRPYRPVLATAGLRPVAHAPHTLPFSNGPPRA
jgi:hypothetical protein